MEEKELREKVKSILTSLQNTRISGVINKDGKLDVEKFNNLTKVKVAVKKLDRLGVSRKYLIQNFFSAGMVLHSLKK